MQPTITANQFGDDTVTTVLYALADEPDLSYGYEMTETPQATDVPPRASTIIAWQGNIIDRGGAYDFFPAAEPPTQEKRESAEHFAERVAAADALRAGLYPESQTYPARLLEIALQRAQGWIAARRDNEARAADARAVAARTQAEIRAQEDADLAIYLACQRGMFIAQVRAAADVSDKLGQPRTGA